MPSGSGIYEDEPREERNVRPKHADAPKSEQAPDDLGSELSVESPE